MGRGPLQNVGNFDHFHHECGSASLEVVACADAGEDSVDEPNFGLLSGNKTAGLCQNGHQGHRSEIGGFSTHVGAGDEQKTSLLVHGNIVRNKTGLCFQNRMASPFKLNVMLVGDFWFGPISFPADRSKALENINGSDTTCNIGQGSGLGAAVGAKFKETPVLKFFQF